MLLKNLIPNQYNEELSTNQDIFNDYHKLKDDSIVKRLDFEEASDFIIKRHYAGRVPPISVAYGWYVDKKLESVISFGKPASHTLCENICGEEFKDNVYELNRLVRNEDFNKQLSQFVSCCLRMLKNKDWIIVSYSDMGMHHHGYIYQACNFIYTGCSERRLDTYTNGKHPRHGDWNDSDIKQLRTKKYRYIYFCTNNKKLKKTWMENLKYDILPYPKGDNKNYELGTVYKPVLYDKHHNILNENEEYLFNTEY